MTWPTIPAPSFTTGGEVYLPVVRTEFEGGYVQSRKAVLARAGSGVSAGTT